MEVCHKVEGTAIGGGGGGDARVHLLLVHQLVLVTCRGGNLILDGGDAVGVQLFSRPCPRFLGVDIPLERGVGTLTGFGLAVDVLLQLVLRTCSAFGLFLKR